MLKEDLPTAIGAGGALHMDANNDVSRLSIVIFLSHLPQDYCPGKFILPSESVYCVTAPYTAIICSGHLVCKVFRLGVDILSEAFEQ